MLLLSTALSAQSTETDWTQRPWPAHWIVHPTASATEFGVFHFRREFELEEVPDALMVMVSADPRYQLSVNGQWVGEGPSRGDLQHWRYETYDIAPFLRTGKNVISAQVWNFWHQ